MAVWHYGLLLLLCHCPHSRWPSLTHVLSSHRQPWFYGWGFNLPRGQALLEKWNLIPEGVDVLVTHGPPLGKTQPAPRTPAPAGGGRRGCGCWQSGRSWACGGELRTGSVLSPACWGTRDRSPRRGSYLLSTDCVPGARWVTHSRVVRSDQLPLLYT